MEQLNNPFVIYGYKGAEYFYDRFFVMWLRKNCAASL